MPKQYVVSLYYTQARARRGIAYTISAKSKGGAEIKALRKLGTNGVRGATDVSVSARLMEV